MIVPDPGTKRFLEESCQAYEEALGESPASEYLSKRGITNQTQAYFRLGYVKDPLPGHEWYRGKLCIPYLTRAGVMTLRFRTLPDENGIVNGEKYLSLPGDLGMARPYNPMDLARDEDFVFITEGEMDCMTVHQIGLPAVGFPGAKQWKSLYRRLFRYRKVTILADGDEPGLDFAKKVAASIPGSVIIQMPKGEDVNSFFLLAGEEGLRDKIGIKDLEYDDGNDSDNVSDNERTPGDDPRGQSISGMAEDDAGQIGREDESEGLGREGDASERDDAGTARAEAPIRPAISQWYSVYEPDDDEVCDPYDPWG